VNNIPEYTVSQLNKSIKDLLEENYSYLKLVGETGSITIASSGHVYFSIKENDEVISCICWKGSYENLQVQIEEGTEYSFYGRIIIPIITPISDCAKEVKIAATPIPKWYTTIISERE